MQDQLAQTEPQTPEKRSFFSQTEILHAIEEDPFFRFLWQWRRQIGMIILVAAAVWYITYRSQESYVASMKRASAIYATVRDGFDTLADKQKELTTAQAAEDAEQVASIEDDIKEVPRILQERLTVLAQQKFPYDQVAAAYKGLLAVQSGDMESVAAQLAELQWKEAGSPLSPERFYAELPALIFARTLLDTKDTYSQGHTALMALAKEGSFARVSAVLTLSQIAESEEEKKKVRTVIEEILEDEPEQRSLLSEELERLS